MKDITARSFGLIIAYFLPGYACIFLIFSWYARLSGLIQKFMPTKSDFGSVLNVICLSLVLGLILNAIRWAMYEQFFLRKIKLEPGYFRNLTDDESVRAIETTLDENFRYHQFYGSFSLIFPFFLIHICSKLFDTLPFSKFKFWCFIIILLVFAVFLLLEIIIVSASVTAYRRYVYRCKAIMKGGEKMPNGGPGNKKKSSDKKKETSEPKKKKTK